jgi:hypothetical protein
VRSVYADGAMPRSPTLRATSTASATARSRAAATPPPSRHAQVEARLPLPAGGARLQLMRKRLRRTQRQGLPGAQTGIGAVALAHNLPRLAIVTSAGVAPPQPNTRHPPPANPADDHGGQRHVSGEADLREAIWPEALVARGYRPERPSVWLIEGLLYYLTRPAVHGLLEQVRSLTATDSLLGLDVMNRGLFFSPMAWPMQAALARRRAPGRFATNDPETLMARHGG